MNRQPYVQGQGNQRDQSEVVEEGCERLRGQRIKTKVKDKMIGEEQERGGEREGK